MQTIFLNYRKFSKFLIRTNLIWKKFCINIMPITCPLLLITFFQNSAAYMLIVAQDNKFQKNFIISVLELIMVKMLQYVGLYVGPVSWGCISNNIKMLPLQMFSHRVKSDCLLGIDFYVWYIQYVICKMFLNVDLKLSTSLVSLFCFYFVLNSRFVLHLYYWNLTVIKYRLDMISWRLWPSSPNLCCLF